MMLFHDVNGPRSRRPRKPEGMDGDPRSLLPEKDLLSKEAFLDLTESLISEWFLLNFQKVNDVIQALCSKTNWIRVPELREKFECDALEILVEIFDLADEVNDALRAYEETDQAIVANSLALFGEILAVSLKISDESVVHGMHAVLRNFPEYSPNAKCQGARLMRNGFGQKSNRPMALANEFVRLCMQEVRDQAYDDVCLELLSALSIMAKKAELIELDAQRCIVEIMQTACERFESRAFAYVACGLFYLLKSDETMGILESPFVREFISRFAQDPTSDEVCFYECEMLILCFLHEQGNLAELIPDFGVFHRFLHGEYYNQHAIVKLFDLAITAGSYFVQKMLDSSTFQHLLELSDTVDFEIRRLITLCICDAFKTGTIDQVTFMATNNYHDLIITTVECQDQIIIESALEALLAIAQVIPAALDTPAIPSIIAALPEETSTITDLKTLLRETMSSAQH